MATGHETLGDNVLPISYSLRLEPNMKSFRYKGEEKISVIIRQDTDTIRLNALELRIISASLIQKGKSYPARIRLFPEKELLELKIGRKVHGEAIIKINFIGINNDHLSGFYRSKYTNGKKTEYMLTTQFEPSSARQAFPCIDEPEFKSTYDISMLVEEQFDCISNMPVRSTKKTVNGKKLVIFDTTPKMSSYLLYLCVGKFDFRKGKLGKVDIRIVTTPGKGKFTDLALTYAKESIRFFEKYFGVSYQLPKLDLIAVPDFASGAMENWGAITFREIALLNTNQTSAAWRQNIALYISHEIAHQWFGDLVTMKWWDDLWLNESFASFMEYKFLDSIHSSWKIMLQYANSPYLVHTMNSAFTADSLNSTHPINMKVNTPGEINDLFDKISYDKGCFVLFMLEDYLGKERFSKALHKYLIDHAYESATKFDLWNSMETGTKDMDMQVSDYMKKWIDQPGYPIINAEKKRNGYRFSQRRFLLIGKSNETWPISIHYKVGNVDRKILIEKDGFIETDSDPIKLNYGQMGMYRVCYDEETLNKLGGRIKERKMNAIDAWGVENDLFALARSGSIKLTKYLNFVEKYCIDAEYPTNQGIAEHLNWLVIMGEGKSFGPRVKKISTSVQSTILGKLDWNKKKSDTNIDIMLRGTAISGLGLVGDEETISKAVSIFNSGKEIDPDIRGPIYAIAAANGSEDTFKLIIKRFNKSELPEEQNRLLVALGKFREKELALEAIEFSESNKVRLQDSYKIISSMSSNPIRDQVIWPWVKANWKKLMARYPVSMKMLSRFITCLGLTSDINTKEELLHFFSNKDNMRDDINRDLLQTLEIIDANINFINANE